MEKSDSQFVKIINGFYTTLSLVSFPLALIILLFVEHNILFAMLSMVPWLATTLYLILASRYYQISNNDLIIFKSKKLNIYIMSFASIITYLILNGNINFESSNISIYISLGVIFLITSYYVNSRLLRVKEHSII